MSRFNFIILGLIFSQSSYAMLIGTDVVDGTNSLYTSDWGHPYNTGSGNESNAIARGNNPQAFEVLLNPFAFTSGMNLRISASGLVVDDGSRATGPGEHGGDFRNLPVYGLIGIWSSDPNSILPVEVDLISVNPAFYIGDLLNLVVPTYTSSLYLFMADNDGGFADNSGFYSVRIEQIPAPSALLLMLIGFASLRKRLATS
ncbi:MAG: hypothetical protein COB26_07220 [Piscirickettsiaceae bacterium]|nr:MAG: hypothetical protein COB26_07220 [Piscirickettsiaceae bacterium]